MLEVISVEMGAGISDDDLAFLLSLASPQKRALSHGRAAAAVTRLAADAAVRMAIRARAGPGALDFSANQYGKPYLPGRPDIHFNLSHSGHLAVCAVDDQNVGIDVEFIKPAKPNVAKRFFSGDEYAFWAESGSDRAFYELWTMKESFVKWDGAGLSKPLDSFSVLEFQRRGRPLFHPVFVGEDACCHVCSESGRVDSHTRYTLDSFLDAARRLR